MDFNVVSKELLSFAQALFGQSNVSVLEFRDPAAMEIDIDTMNETAAYTKISIYDEIGLHIAGMDFEYGPYSQEGITEVKRFLVAAKENRLRKYKRKILGIPIGERLVIAD